MKTRELTENEKKLLLTKKELDFLEHSLGLPRAKKPYRNYFAMMKNGGADYPVIRGLVERGLMIEGSTSHNTFGGLTFFHVTDLGMQALGLEPNKE